MKTATTKPVSVKLNDDMRTRIEHLATTRRRSAHWMMREAIQQYVEREEKHESFRQDALNAWEELQLTGQHANEAEVDDWLASWGTDDELPPPECHN